MRSVDLSRAIAGALVLVAMMAPAAAQVPSGGMDIDTYQSCWKDLCDQSKEACCAQICAYRACVAGETSTMAPRTKELEPEAPRTDLTEAERKRLRKEAESDSFYGGIPGMTDRAQLEVRAYTSCAPHLYPMQECLAQNLPKPASTDLTPEMSQALTLYSRWLTAEYDFRLARAKREDLRVVAAQNEANRLRSEYERALHLVQNQCEALFGAAYRNQPVDWVDAAVADALGIMPAFANRGETPQRFRTHLEREIRPKFQNRLAETCGPAATKEAAKAKPAGPTTIDVPAGGTILLRRAGKPDYRATGPRSVAVDPGDTIRVLQGRAVMRRDGAQHTLHRDSISTYHGHTVELLSGTITVKEAGKPTLSVSTPEATSFVSGTEYTVERRAGERVTRFAVSVGQLQVRAPKHALIAVNAGEAVEIGGDFSVRTAGAKGQPAALSRSLSGLWRVAGAGTGGAAVLFHDGKELFLSVAMSVAGRTVVWNGNAALSGDRAEGTYWLNQSAPPDWPRGGGSFGDGTLSLALAPQGKTLTGSLRSESGNWSAAVTLERSE